MEVDLKFENLAKNAHLITLPSSLWGLHIHPQYEFIAILHLDADAFAFGKFYINKGILLTKEEGNFIKAEVSIDGQIVDSIPNTSSSSKIESISDVSVLLFSLADAADSECLIKYTTTANNNNYYQDESYCFNHQHNKPLSAVDNNFNDESCSGSVVIPLSSSSLTANNNTYHQEEKIINNKKIERNLCNICGKTFNCLTNLDEHLLIHSNSKRFMCKECGKSFAKKYNLNVHIRTHSGEKPYVCSKCGKRFSSKSNFSTHMMSVHCNNNNNNKKRHTCEICNMTFIYPRVLKIHKRIHSGEKPFMCQICGKLFSKNIHLTVHTRTHTGEKPHICNLCGKGFTTSGNLKSHITINHTLLLFN